MTAIRVLYGSYDFESLGNRLGKRQLRNRFNRYIYTALGLEFVRLVVTPPKLIYPNDR